MENRSIYRMLGQAFIALAIVTSSLVVASTLKKIKFSQGSVSVKGCAEKEIQSDFVKWQGSISATAETQSLAYERLEQDLALLNFYFKEHGLTDKVELSPISTTSVHKLNSQGSYTNEIENYTLLRDFTIQSKDTGLITQLSQNITSLIKEGLAITSLAPQYFYIKIDELKIAMLGEAAKDARLRAEKLVGNNNGHVGMLHSANQGVFQITPAFSNSLSDYGEYDTTSIAKRIKAVVTMEYVIEH